MDVPLADNSVKNWRDLPISNLKPYLHNINAHTKFSEIYHPEKKTWMCWGQITVKNWRNLPISNPKPDHHNINVHTKFGENPLTFTCYHPRKENTDGRT